MKTKLCLLILAAALPLLLSAQNANTTDAFIGTWKLNVDKSHFSPGPAPTSETVTIAADHVNVHDVMKTPSGENTSDWSYTTAPDGQSAQITGNGMQNSSVTSKRVNDRTIEHTWNFNGQVMHGRAVVSKDGKTMRYTMTGTSNGKAVHDIETFEKQGS